MKSKVLNSGFVELERDISKSLYFGSFSNNVHTKYSYEEAKNLRELNYTNNFEFFHEAEKINHASRQRSNRLYKRIEQFFDEAMLLDLNLLFLTLTFRDDVLESTNPDSRHRYVSRFLKSNCLKYVANKDFGSKNGREHYHALVLVNGRLDYTSWLYGALNGEKVVYSANSSVKLAKYISKLTNHSIKETTKRSVLIYSR